MNKARLPSRYSKSCKVGISHSTNWVMKRFLLICAAATLTLPLLAKNKSLSNLGINGLATQGYDPVAFFTDSKPILGKPEFQIRPHGALYYFTSKEHRDLFKTDPAKFEPAFGGFCAYGVSRNKLVEIDVNAFQIVDGRLLLQYSKGVRTDFNKDTKGNLAKADGNWPGLVEKKGK